MGVIVCATWRVWFIYLFAFFVFLDSSNSHLSPSLLLSALFSCHFTPQFTHNIRISGHTTLLQASNYTAVLQLLVLTTHWRWHHRPTGSKDEPATHELHWFSNVTHCRNNSNWSWHWCWTHVLSPTGHF